MRLMASGNDKFLQNEKTEQLEALWGCTEAQPGFVLSAKFSDDNAYVLQQV